MSDTFLASITVTQRRNGTSSLNEPSAERSEDGAGSEIAEHRTEAEPAHQRHDDAGGAEHDQRIGIGVEIDR